MKKGKKYKIWVEIQNITVLFVPAPSTQLSAHSTQHQTAHSRTAAGGRRQEFSRTAGHYTVLKYVRS
jgi:hypothetical protein